MNETIMQKIPWQGLFIIILVALVLLFVLLIILVAKNKNLESKINYKDNDFGLSIKDSENQKPDKNKNEYDNNLYNRVLFSLIKTHPLYTTTFNHFVYSDSENTINMVKNVISQYGNNKIDNVIDFKMSYIGAMYKTYIYCIKIELDPILTTLNDAIKTNKCDELYSKIDNFIEYIETLNIVKNALDINKLMVYIQNYNIEGSSFKHYIKTLNEDFNYYIRNACSELKRDIVIYRSNMDNFSNDNESVKLTMIMVSIIRIFDSILDHIYGIISKYRIKQIDNAVSIDGEL